MAGGPGGRSEVRSFLVPGPELIFVNCHGEIHAGRLVCVGSVRPRTVLNGDQAALAERDSTSSRTGTLDGRGGIHFTIEDWGML
jgi:hypothetical protein